jgi:small-conductance mechanosensitive channel
MQGQSQSEPLPQDFLAWQADLFDKKKSAFLILKQHSRAVWTGVAGLSAVVVLAYSLTQTSSAKTVSSPNSPAIEQASQSVVSSSSEMDALRTAISTQNATNQQIAAAIDALRAEQKELRKQIAAMQAALQSPATTGSISPHPQAKPLPPKKMEQGQARHVPYPDPRQVPYPPRSN